MPLRRKPPVLLPPVSRARRLFGSCCLALGALPALVAAEVSAQEPPAQIAVSPPRIELELGARPVRESFRLTNLGDQPVEVQVSVGNWDLDEHNQVRMLPPTEQSLDQWMIINPTRFTVSAGESQVVRFAVRPRVRPAPGEHRAIIYFAQQPTDQSADDRRRVLFRLGAAVYAYVGDVDRRGRLLDIEHDASARPPRFLFDIESVGDAHVRLNGHYAVWPQSSYPGRPGTLDLPDVDAPGFRLPAPLVAAGRLPSTPVLAGSRRQIPLRIASALPAGAYVLDIRVKLGDEEIVRAVPFSVSAAH